MDTKLGQQLLQFARCWTQKTKTVLLQFVRCWTLSWRECCCNLLDVGLEAGVTVLLGVAGEFDGQVL